MANSDSESDPELESLVDFAFSKAKASFQFAATTTTTTEASDSPTTTVSTRLRSKRLKNILAKQEVSQAPEPTRCHFRSVSKPPECDKQSNSSFFIDKNPDLKEIDCSEDVINISGSTSTVRHPDSDSESSSSDEDADQLANNLAHAKEDEVETSEKSKTDIAKQNKRLELSSSLQSGIDTSDIYVNVQSYSDPKEHLPQIDSLLLGGQDQIMKKSVIGPDFEKRDTVLPYAESINRLRKQRRKERSMTKGKNWYNLPATELTDERKNDLKVLQMRHALDPKRFYRANDMRTTPKYFQFGRVVESKADFYSSRIPKKQRKSTLVEELLADADFRSYNKRKYTEIQEAKRTGTGPYQKMRFPKKRKQIKN